jgi:endonuclease III
MSKQDIARALVERHGTTYAEQAGIRLKDAPAPLYQLLVLSVLLSARISADVATAAAKELFKAGYRTPKAMRDATWQERVDALGRGHYRRYDERTATMLGDGAALVLGSWKGDLRRMHDEAGNTGKLEELLQQVPGLGPSGAAIFCREVQGVWTDIAPYVDDKVAQGAQRVGLPKTPDRLASYAPSGAFPQLASACVRAALSKDVVADVRG